MPTPTFQIDSARVGALAVTTTTGAAQSIAPTPTWETGWSAVTAFSLTILSGNLGYLTGAVKSTSTIAAGTSVQVATLAFPNGIAPRGAIAAPLASENGFSQLNGSGSFYLRFWSAMAANRTYDFRMLVPLSGVPASLLPQPPP